MNTEQDFWNKIDICSEDECWDWLEGVDKDGYGRLSFQGRTIKSYHLAWILTFGDIPKNKQLNHKCNNRLCCNPNHLYAGTQIENMQDRILKLTRKDIDDIIYRYSNGLNTEKELSFEYKVSYQHISNIITGKVWR